ncbi:RNA ligase family protein [Cohnella caldifontis]|uniref:ATP-dependent DNA ligase n=1 Tax=Cohnella caldifontis TaxID=3027471 RepID=UPI0023EBFFF3|nr:RNA ligase family protein [Cohnella sp. YIM B05605]
MFMPPMLLEKREEPFDDDKYVFEPKIDGHRMIVSVENGLVRLYTRRGIEVTRQYPELLHVPLSDMSDAVLDGEVACVDGETGTVDFESLQRRFLLRRPMAIMQAKVRHPVIFFAFDILRYEGEDLRSLTLMERKEILAGALGENAHYSRMIYVEDTGISLFEAIREKRLEGIVAKAKNSPYVGRRDASWLKIINYSYADVRITGYRKRQFGWLIEYRGEPAGILELAVPPSHKKAFYGVAGSIVTGEDRDYVYVKPSIRARVRFRDRAFAGVPRLPEFVDFVV